MKILNFKLKKLSTGYTIVETMIAVSLFLVVVVMGMGALLNANLIHQKSRDMRSIIDNLSFIMEDMGRNLRTGYNYHCFAGGDNLSGLDTPRSCQNGWGIAFESSNGNPASTSDQWIYMSNNSGKFYKSTDGGANLIQLNPDTPGAEVVIDPLTSFIVTGAEPPPGDSLQPVVTIKLVGKIIYKNEETPFYLQTTVSQRAIDL